MGNYTEVSSVADNLLPKLFCLPCSLILFSSVGLKKNVTPSHDGLVILAGAMPFTVVQTLKIYNVQCCPDGEAKHKTGAFSFSSRMNSV